MPDQILSALTTARARIAEAMRNDQPEEYGEDYVTVCIYCGWEINLLAPIHDGACDGVSALAEIDAAIEERKAQAAELAALKEALSRIARQETTEELETDDTGEVYSGDVEAGYDAIIEEAREALRGVDHG